MAIPKVHRETLAFPVLEKTGGYRDQGEPDKDHAGKQLGHAIGKAEVFLDKPRGYPDQIDEAHDIK